MKKDFTIFSTTDRLHPDNQPQTPVRLKIPVVDMQTQLMESVFRELDEEYQDQIETLNLKLIDQEEVIKVLRDINDGLTLRTQALQANIEQEQEYRIGQTNNSYQLNQRESEVVKLEHDLMVEVGNRDHFRSLVAQQDAIIREFKVKLEGKTRETEHLAKQTVKLNSQSEKDRAIIRNKNYIIDTLTNALNTLSELSFFFFGSKKKIIRTCKNKVNELNKDIDNLVIGKVPNETFGKDYLKAS